jgi:hypothetical protein
MDTRLLRPHYARPVPNRTVKLPCVTCHRMLREESLGGRGECRRCENSRASLATKGQRGGRP